MLCKIFACIIYIIFTYIDINIYNKLIRVDLIYYYVFIIGLRERERKGYLTWFFSRTFYSILS